MVASEAALALAASVLWETCAQFTSNSVEYGDLQMHHRHVRSISGDPQGGQGFGTEWRHGQCDLFNQAGRAGAAVELNGAGCLEVGPGRGRDRPGAQNGMVPLMPYQ